MCQIEKNIYDSSNEKYLWLIRVLWFNMNHDKIVRAFFTLAQHLAELEGNGSSRKPIYD